MSTNTENKQPIVGEEAKAKMKELAENARICMMCTDLDKRPIPSRPMAIQEVDADGILWFLSSKTSDKNHEIRKDAEVQLYFNNTSASEYLSIYGRAEIYTDQKTIEDKYSEMANSWFDGEHDPNLTAIGIRAEQAYYWDTKENATLAKMKTLFSAVTGKKTDVGVEGELTV